MNKPTLQTALSQIQTAPVTWAGRLLYILFPYRRRLIHSNITQVFGHSLKKQDRKRLIQAFYSHLATSIKETFSLMFLSEAALKARVQVLGHEHVLKVAEKGKGVLLLTAHIGNWEFAPLGGMLNFKEFKGHLHFIRRTLKNKTIERILFGRYFKAGFRIIPKARGSLNQVCDALDENHAVIFVLDQHAYLHTKDGIAVDFFGKKAGTYRSLASIARHTEVPVVPAITYREKEGSHKLVFLPPIQWEEAPTTQEALALNTRRYNEAIENMILAHPTQWMWLHRRWKL